MFDFMIVSTPIVVTRLAAVAAYFDDDAVAFCEPDDPKSMARAILRLYHDPLRRASMTRRASELYEHYGWPAQKTRYVHAYRRLLA